MRDICVPSVASARGDFYAVTPYRTVVVNRNKAVGSGEPLQSPLRPPGTDVKVGTESKGDGELPPSRWWSELTVIHAN